MVKLSTVIPGNVWRTFPPPNPPQCFTENPDPPIFCLFLFVYILFIFNFFFYTQNIPSTSADQTKQRLKTMFKTPSLFHSSTPLRSLEVILNRLNIPPPPTLSPMPPPPSKTAWCPKGDESEGSRFDQMQYSFFSSELVWPPSALMMAVSASAASSAPLASCVKQVPEGRGGGGVEDSVMDWIIACCLDDTKD